MVEGIEPDQQPFGPRLAPTWRQAGDKFRQVPVAHHLMPILNSLGHIQSSPPPEGFLPDALPKRTLGKMQ